jgi:hypothetical protein
MIEDDEEEKRTQEDDPVISRDLARSPLSLVLLLLPSFSHVHNSL